MWLVSSQSVCGLRDVPLQLDPLIDCSTSEVLTLYDIAAAEVDKTRDVKRGQLLQAEAEH